MDYNEAINYLTNRKVDLAIVDINISGEKTGIDIAKYINKYIKIPFIYLTSYTDRQTIAKILETHPAGYLSKPINEINLLTMIELAVKKHFNPNSYISIAIGNKTYRFQKNSVLYACSDHVYVKLYLREKTLLLRTSLKNLIDKLPKGVLKRYGKSIALNPLHISHLTSKTAKIGDMVFNISSRYLD
jgi:DNA-binding LytR/AlgR family response regulator